MDEALRAIKRQAEAGGSVGDWLGFIAAARSAGSKVEHEATWQARDALPLEEGVVAEWTRVHGEAAVYVMRQNDSRVVDEYNPPIGVVTYGREGRVPLNIPLEGLKNACLFACANDMFLAREEQGVQDRITLHSFIREGQHLIALPEGRIRAVSSVVTTPEGTFVKAYGCFGLAMAGPVMYDQVITHLESGDERRHVWRLGREERDFVSGLFRHRGKLAYGLRPELRSDAFGRAVGFFEEPQGDVAQAFARYISKRKGWSAQNDSFVDKDGRIVDRNVHSQVRISDYFYQELLRKYA